MNTSLHVKVAPGGSGIGSKSNRSCSKFQHFARTVSFNSYNGLGSVSNNSLPDDGLLEVKLTSAADSSETIPAWNVLGSHAKLDRV